jgi:hypothetical protein
LVLGALNVAYGQHNVNFQGPFPTAFLEISNSFDVTITYGNAHLDIRNNGGFEVRVS